MNKKLLIPIFALMLFAAANIYAAEPFNAPAVFDFSGSTIYLEATVDTFLGEYPVDINPNPVPVDAKIYVDTLDASGNWTGYGEGTGSTTATAPVVGNIPVSAEAGGSGAGHFDFANDTVTVHSDDAWAKVNVGGTEYILDIDDGDVEGTFDGEYMYFSYSGEEQFEIMDNVIINFSFDVDAVGKLETEAPTDALNAFIDTDKTDYNSGDTFECSIGIERIGPEITVDAWIVLINPADELLFFPEFTFQPNYIADLTIPEDFVLFDIPIFNQTLPGTFPPIQATGQYIIALGFSIPGDGPLTFYSIGSDVFNYTE